MVLAVEGMVVALAAKAAGDTAVGLVAVAVLGFVALAWMATKLYREDRDWRREHDQRAVGASLAAQPRSRITMISPRLVEDREIRELLDRFGHEWPPVEVLWPQSLTKLRNCLGAGLTSMKEQDFSAPGASTFVKDEPEALARADALCARAQDAIPRFVRRTVTQLAVRSFLLHANYAANKHLAWLSGWEGLTRRSLFAPEEWKPLQPWDEKRAILASIMGEDPKKPMANGRCEIASGFKICAAGDGPGPHLCAPLEELKAPSTDAVCRWLIPQLALADVKELPPTYRFDRWFISKVTPF